MNVNWPERLWCNSPLRRLVQRRELALWLANLPPIPNGAVLEIGCGNGAGAALILEAFAPRTLVALDTDPDMVARARQRLANEGERATALVADAQHVPLPDRSVDMVANFGIIHHLEDWRAGVAEVARVLKPGGIFYFEEIYPPLYANALMRLIVAHPEHDRFHGPEFKAALERNRLAIQPWARESRLGILGAAVKNGGG